MTLRARWRCPACGGRELWQIDPVRGHGDAPLELFFESDHAFGSVPAARGHTSFSFCATCGAGDWFAQGATFDGDVAVLHVRARCVECGSTDAHRIRPMRGRARDGLAEEWRLYPKKAHYYRGIPFTIDVCDGCARIGWEAYELYDLASSVGELDDVSRVTSARPCACGADERWRCTGVHDIRGALIRLGTHTTVVGERAVGELIVELCVGCGRAHWFARDFAKLEANRARGVVRVFGKDDAGPYR